MEKRKMTIHRALAELKLIDAKIEKGISELKPLALNQKDKKVNGYLTEDEFKKQAESAWNSVNDLIKFKVLIKNAIVDSNAKTKVKIGPKDFTVAEAITFRKIIEQKKQLSKHLTAHFNAATSLLNKNNEQVDKNADEIVKHSLGADKTKEASKDAVDNIKKPYLENNTFHLIDPLNVQEKIKSLEAETGEFEAEVDAVLSESNSTTFIEL